MPISGFALVLYFTVKMPDTPPPSYYKKPELMLMRRATASV